MDSQGWNLPGALGEHRSQCPVTIDHKSSIGGELTLSLGQITRAEPDPSLFAPPAEYKVHQFPGLARSAAQK